METSNLKENVEIIIEQTLGLLKEVYNNNREDKAVKNDYSNKINLQGSRLVFPKYSNKEEVRVSEQELRFAFVETFNHYCNEKKINLFYSVETPTMDNYSGFAIKNPGCDKNGRSAMFDLVIYDEYLKRRCLIEFKAKNADEKDHKKDFIKLNNPNEGGKDEVLRYFIEILQSSNDGTYKSLNKKINACNITNPEENIKSTFICYDLEKGNVTAKIENFK